MMTRQGQLDCVQPVVQQKEGKQVRGDGWSDGKTIRKDERRERKR